MKLKLEVVHDTQRIEIENLYSNWGPAYSAKNGFNIISFCVVCRELSSTTLFLNFFCLYFLRYTTRSTLHAKEFHAASVILKFSFLRALRIFYELYTACKEAPCGIHYFKNFCSGSLQMYSEFCAVCITAPYSIFYLICFYSNDLQTF